MKFSFFFLQVLPVLFNGMMYPYPVIVFNYFAVKIASTCNPLTPVFQRTEMFPRTFHIFKFHLPCEQWFLHRTLRYFALHARKTKTFYCLTESTVTLRPAKFNCKTICFAVCLLLSVEPVSSSSSKSED